VPDQAKPLPAGISPADIAHRFTNHPPAYPATGELLDEVTHRFIALGTWLAAAMPPGREASTAVTKLEEASMWTKAAIARAQR
jgi:hypothetical protein